MRIGRYRICWGRYAWFQTYQPVTVRRFLCFIIVKEARVIRKLNLWLWLFNKSYRRHHWVAKNLKFYRLPGGRDLLTQQRFCRWEKLG